jgi:hypothetical protein
MSFMQDKNGKSAWFSRKNIATDYDLLVLQSTCETRKIESDNRISHEQYCSAYEHGSS